MVLSLSEKGDKTTWYQKKLIYLLLFLFVHVLLLFFTTWDLTLPDCSVPDEGIDADLRMKLQSLLEEGKPEVLANAAMLGDVYTIREYLQKYPNDVCLDHGVLY